MKIRFKNPVCEYCKLYRPKAVYHWICAECLTHYKAEKYRKGTEEWFEYTPSVTDEMVKIPMGVSQWLEYGEKYKYLDYFRNVIAHSVK